jgi:predicted GNAT family acetyltransferase
MALITTIREADTEREIGVARYVCPSGRGAAGIAIVVSDEWQGKGTGSRMLRDLLDVAHQAGIWRRGCCPTTGACCSGRSTSVFASGSGATAPAPLNSGRTWTEPHADPPGIRARCRPGRGQAIPGQFPLGMTAIKPGRRPGCYLVLRNAAVPRTQAVSAGSTMRRIAAVRGGIQKFHKAEETERMPRVTA